MCYDGPRHERITKKLRKIAKEYNLKLWFKPSISFSGEYHVGDDRAVVQLDNPSATVISTFFHELGHHIDFHEGRFPTFYDISSPLYRQRKVALKAERHADMVGQRLCKKYFPNVKFQKSYRSESDIDYLRYYYADGRTNLKKILTTIVKKAKV